MKKGFVFLFLLYSFALSAQKSVVPDCRIWQPASFCDSIREARFFPIWRAGTFFRDEVDCKKLDQDKYAGVWLKLNRHYGRKFELKSGLDNIKLVRKDGSKVTPTAVFFGYPNEGNPKRPIYLSSGMTTNSLILKYGLRRTADLIMIFPAAEPGDKVIIDDYVEAVILKN